jgi:hypothetical protein
MERGKDLPSKGNRLLSHRARRPAPTVNLAVQVPVQALANSMRWPAQNGGARSNSSAPLNSAGRSIRQAAQFGGTLTHASRDGRLSCPFASTAVTW